MTDSDASRSEAARSARLICALEEAGALSYFIQRVRDGVYVHFRSTRVNRQGENLISHATREKLWDIARRAKAGEFDAP